MILQLFELPQAASSIWTLGLRNGTALGWVTALERAWARAWARAFWPGHSGTGGTASSCRGTAHIISGHTKSARPLLSSKAREREGMGSIFIQYLLATRGTEWEQEWGKRARELDGSMGTGCLVDIAIRDYVQAFFNDQLERGHSAEPRRGGGISGLN
ncbi:hypothetical protein FIBSPDRAFT_890294 [Athelia psychrophila]|uniref:Uncharacterized protein n=1 Tax=Athelia psychrophila TaxID=1759441 RepID=A0A166L8C6_9AGAM|nr:hypothetical protein FIBSPDRAFT_890294 [Fibularhizoctonia sp. CBS 109695]